MHPAVKMPLHILDMLLNCSTLAKTDFEFKTSILELFRRKAPHLPLWLFILAAICQTLGSTLSAKADTAGIIAGAFIQLNRANAEWPAERWNKIFDEMHRIKMNTVLIQWCADSSVSYFKNKNLPYSEQYDAIERIMKAAQEHNFFVHVGLQNDPEFWKEITARDKALRDYFLVRRAKNERLQSALLAQFNTCPCWQGYYIPDEIDDLSWRNEKRRSLLKDYLCATAAGLRQNDPKRTVAVSAFVRARTAPAVFTSILRDLTDGISLDYLLIQDGAGAGDPPPDVLPLYYRALLGKASRSLPELWCVLEAFQQTSANNEPFAATAASVERFRQQIRAASSFKRRIVFSFPEYLEPDAGPDNEKLYKSLLPSTSHRPRD